MGGMVKAGKYKTSKYHKAESSQPSSGLGDVGKYFYKTHVWVVLGGVNKACEEGQDIAE